MRKSPLALPFLASCALHACAALIALLLPAPTEPSRPAFLPIRLVEAPEEKRAAPRAQGAAEKKKKAPSRKEPPAAAPRPAEPPRNEPRAGEKPNATEVPAAELSPRASASPAEPESPAPDTRPSGELLASPKTGAEGWSGEAPDRRLGRKEEPSSRARESRARKAHREARPIETARATYPPMALRMGLEADVTLRIEVDTEGKVVKAEIVKAAGMGFDEEALKAVRRSRFEPAEEDGTRVPAEFTYVYRFRLRR